MTGPSPGAGIGQNLHSLMGSRKSGENALLEKPIWMDGCQLADSDEKHLIEGGDINALMETV